MATKMSLQVELTGGGAVSVSVEDLAMLTAIEHTLIRDLLDIAATHAGATSALAAAVEPIPPPVLEDPVTPRRPAATSTPVPARSSKAKIAKAPKTPDLGVQLLDALHKVGGEIFDPSGSATARLAEAAGTTVSTSRVSQVLRVLVDEGLVNKAGGRTTTTRLALTAKGLAVVDDRTTQAEPPSPKSSPTLTSVPDPVAVINSDRPTSTSKGVASMCLSENHVLCQATRCSCGCHHGTRGAA